MEMAGGGGGGISEAVVGNVMGEVGENSGKDMLLMIGIVLGECV